MPTARITRGQYEALVEAFRERPGVVAHAARRAKVTHRTAKRAWEIGWERPDWARPISEEIKTDQVAARAKLKAEQAKAEEQVARAKEGAELREKNKLARLDAAEERSREAQAVRASLSTSLTMLANLGSLSKASVAMSQQAAKDILVAVQQQQIPWRVALEVLSKIVLMSERVSNQLKQTMESLRLHTGDPQQILGFVDAAPASTDVDGEKALEVFGEERLSRAIIDLASGNMSEDATTLLEWQVAQGEEGAERRLN
jgi:hypothetical protein